MKVFGWAGGYDGCRYYRLEVPLTALRGIGHTTAISSHWNAKNPVLPRTDAALGLPINWREDVNTLVGQRISAPGPSSLWQQTCEKGDIFCVYEMDDDLFSLDPTNKSFHFYSDGDVQRRVEDNIRAAHRVTVSTEHLAERIGALNDDVRVIPNTLPRERLMNARVTHWSTPNIGYTASPTHAGDWAVVSNALKRVIADMSNVSLHVMGTDYGAELRLGSRYVFHDWQREMKMYLAVMWHRFDVGIAPLKTNLFNRSKSHIKALEYAAVGCPTVASAYDPYENFVQHGQTGLLVRNPWEWRKHLRTLLEDREMRQQMGMAARERAESFVVERWVRTWEAALTR